LAAVNKKMKGVLFMFGKNRKGIFIMKSTLILIIAILMMSACGSAKTAEVKARQDFAERMTMIYSFTKVPGFSVRYETEGEESETLSISIINWSETKIAEPAYLNDTKETDARILKFKRVRVSHADGRQEIINL
jgi:hypothetical protein